MLVFQIYLFQKIYITKADPFYVFLCLRVTQNTLQEPLFFSTFSLSRQWFWTHGQKLFHMFHLLLL